MKPISDLRRLCQCEGKQAFASFVLAQQVSDQTGRRHNNKGFAPYHCAGCGQFHIGSTKKTKAKKQLRRKLKSRNYPGLLKST